MSQNRCCTLVKQGDTLWLLLLAVVLFLRWMVDTKCFSTNEHWDHWGPLFEVRTVCTVGRMGILHEQINGHCSYFLWLQPLIWCINLVSQEDIYKYIGLHMLTLCIYKHHRCSFLFPFPFPFIFAFRFDQRLLGEICLNKYPVRPLAWGTRASGRAGGWGRGRRGRFLLGLPPRGQNHGID